MTAPTNTFWQRTRQRANWWFDTLLLYGVRVLFFILVVMLFGDGRSDDAALRGRVTALARDELFDYVGWEVDALWSKARQELFGVHPYLDEDTRHALVRSYLDTLGEIQRIESQINRVYADPDVDDPQAATADLRARRETLRDQLAADQPLAESIIEGQVSAVLADEGFDTLGQILPPVSMHFTEVPTLLVVSPRDRIEFEVDLNLVALSTEERAVLEDEIDTTLDVSSLIVSLGGLSMYPSMILETASTPRAFEVTAHEWVHHYLFFFPLGMEYTARAETRIINETVATFFGREIARKVIERYYPDVIPPVYPSFLDPPSPTAAAPPDLGPIDPYDPPFDYRTEMNNTRVQVDFLLRMGNVEGAELYMELQRRKFVRNGYAIRKLNQAYFAFYGGYQGAPGAGGTDPIGPAVEELRALSPDLKTWLATLRGITTREQLLAAVAAAGEGKY